MMRVFWEEWRSGHEFSSFRVLPGLAVGTAVALLLSSFHPGGLFLVLGLAALAGGALSGTQRWSHLSAREWVGLEGVAPTHYAAGKVVGFVGVLAVWTVFVAPPLLLVGWNWALPPSIVVRALAWVLVGALAAQAVTQAFCWSASEFARLFGTLLVFLWIAGTFQAGGYQSYNPLWQLWHLFQRPEVPFDFGSWSAVLAVAGVLWAIVVAFLGRVEARR